jgi:AraC family transcriptional regulator of adaptative response / DNA-3-methyladenine glycosylase II
MELDASTCYQALLAHDARFDGLFFVGVSTTGIYCRTVCPARTPRRESCTFYSSAASAEQAGYRPCLRCRPELAPGNARIDAVSRLAADAVRRIEEGALADQSLSELAAELGVSDRHLRRVVEAEYGVSPIELAQTQRLHLAKRLLTDTALSATEVAFASGFSSLRRFNALFRERYRLKPTELRKRRGIAEGSETLIAEVAYRPPFAADALLQFLRGRAWRGVEAIDERSYMRTVVIGKHRGWLRIEPSGQKHALRVEFSAALISAFLPLLARVKRLLDLAAEPQKIEAHLGDLAARHPGLRVPGAFDSFEIAVRAILGQQISVKAAITLAGRFVAAFGEPIETPFPALTHLSPSAERVAGARSEELVSLGITAARANTILAMARAITDGKIALEPGADVEKTLVRLKGLPGIGDWTAQYIAMRALSWPDAFPAADLGIRKALSETNPKRVLQIAQAWQPWRSYAAMHLWKSLEKTP